MQAVHLTAAFDIPAEHRARFRELASELIVSVREHEPGALQYLWFYSADGRHCHVREIYRDVKALEAHAKNVGATLGELVKLAKLKASFYGPPSPELRGIVEFLGAELFEYADGVDRLIDGQ